MNREIAARAAAKSFFGTETLLCDLKKGEQFKWPFEAAKAVFTYNGKGWYSCAGIKKSFRSGKFTAVVRIEKNANLPTL